MGDYFQQRFEALRQRCPLIQDVRVKGAMIGIELTVDGAAGGQGVPGATAAHQLHAHDRLAFAARSYSDRQPSANRAATYWKSVACTSSLCSETSMRHFLI